MFYLASKLVSISSGFLFPAYSSYKAIRTNDSAGIENWLMYWVVMGCLHTVENTVEWSISWFPFYYEAKSLIILWLTIPQIQGSTFVYVTYIHPFFLTHEEEIDATLVQARSKARAAGLDYARRAWLAVREAVMGAILASDDQQAASALTGGSATAPAARPQGAPPTLRDPVSSPAQQALQYAGGFLRNYGPSALAAGTVLFRPLQQSQGISSSTQNTKSIEQQARRRQLDSASGNRKSYAGSGLGRVDTTSLHIPRAAAETRRSTSASAALLGATGGQASASVYSTYTRQQLRQRRLQLEQELADLEADTTGDVPAPDDQPISHPSSLQPGGRSSRSGTTSPVFTEDLSRTSSPGNSARDRHISAPTPSYSRQSGPPSLSNSIAGGFEPIDASEMEGVAFPPDWGKSSASKGWRGAPPTQSHGRDVDVSTTPRGEPEAGNRRSTWFWGGQPKPVGPAGPAPGTARKND